MNNTFDEVKAQKSLTERQAIVQEKIRSIPGIGADLEKLMQQSRSNDDMKRLALMASMGRELWEEYWAVLRDTVEQDAEDFFARLEKIESKQKSIW